MDKNNKSADRTKNAELTMLRTDLNLSLRMLRDLIRLHLQESNLKKHHKAYLHVREQMDELCRESWEKADGIMAHYMMPANAIEGNTPDDACDCDGEFCGNELVGKGKRKENSNKKPEGMVLMSDKCLGVMQDDMLALTEGIDLIAKLVRSLMAGQPMHRGILETAISMAEEVSEDVFRRWDDAKLSNVM